MITGDALSKQGRESDFIESDDLPQVPSNICECKSLLYTWVHNVHVGTHIHYRQRRSYHLLFTCNLHCLPIAVANDIALPSYAYRRGSVQEKLPPSVMYRKMLKDSIINTVGLDPVMIEVR